MVAYFACCKGGPGKEKSSKSWVQKFLKAALKNELAHEASAIICTSRLCLVIR